MAKPEGLVPVGGKLLRDVVWEAMRHVTAADKAYKYIQQEGLYAPRREVRQAWKDVMKERGIGRLIQTLGPDKRIPWQWTKTVGIKFDKKYMYVAKVKIKDKSGAVIKTQNVSVQSDNLIPWNAIQSDISAFAEEYLTLEGGSGAEIEPLDIIRSE